MSAKRRRLTMEEYSELTAARDWCQREGLLGLLEYYNDELAFQAYRRALPPEIAAANRLIEDRQDEEQRPRRGGRDRA